MAPTTWARPEKSAAGFRFEIAGRRPCGGAQTSGPPEPADEHSRVFTVPSRALRTVSSGTRQLDRAQPQEAADYSRNSGPAEIVD